MPSLDGGHYFLTALLPIDNHHLYEERGIKSSPVHLVREALEVLPTALQSRASEEIGIQSPFARSKRTHFARLFVIDQPLYNGRDPTDSILATIEKVDLLKAQPVDHLSCPFLAFCADFDPIGEEPRSYLEDLWTLAAPELSTVFGHCYGFADVTNPASFADFVIKGQIDTTMPFNDYWITSPRPFPVLSLTEVVAPIGLAALVAVVAAVYGGMLWGFWAGLGLLVALVVGLGGLAVLFDYMTVMARGAKPLPTAPNSTLRHVLKALYLQQAFARFAAAQQGAAPAELQAAFAAFVAQHKPGELDSPTQAPGVVRSHFPEAADA